MALQSESPKFKLQSSDKPYDLGQAAEILCASITLYVKQEYQQYISHMLVTKIP